MTKTRITIVTEHNGHQIETAHIIVSDGDQYRVGCLTTDGKGSTLRSFLSAVKRAGEQHGEYVRNDTSLTNGEEL
ncbi:MAG: hypothetical protein DRJ03_24080 [Chloroflexi bacterium]|nr:MAG: hypothetical protein DRJ03_24080 [Chloroflexota bacterium]